MNFARFSPFPVSEPWISAFGRCVAFIVVRECEVAGPTVYIGREFDICVWFWSVERFI